MDQLPPINAGSRQSLPTQNQQVSSKNTSGTAVSSSNSKPQDSRLITDFELVNVKEKVVYLKKFFDTKLRISQAVKQGKTTEAKEMYQDLIAGYQKLLKISNQTEANRLHADVSSIYSLISQSSPVQSSKVAVPSENAQKPLSGPLNSKNSSIPSPPAPGLRSSSNPPSLSSSNSSSVSSSHPSSSPHSVSTPHSSSPPLPPNSPSSSTINASNSGTSIPSTSTPSTSTPSTSNAGLMTNSGIKGVKKSHIVQEDIPFSKEEIKRNKRVSVVTTDFDLIIQLLDEKNKLSLTEIENRFNISRGLAEEWVQILADNGLIEIKYLPIGGIEIRKIK